MGFLDMFNDDKKKSGGGSNKNNNNNNNNNPLANIRKNIEQMTRQNQPPRMTGPGQSLGGSKPGTVYAIALPNPGSLGIRVEKRSNNSASAIVSLVVPKSQADSAGLKRGDVLCFAGSDGQDEMPYTMFLDMAKSPQRPLHLEARRFDAKTSSAGGGSADAEARRRAMIAAAEAREKKHKSQTKSIKHVTKSTLLKQREEQLQQQQQRLESKGPQTEASRLAGEAAKRGEAIHIAELGYNPYEAIKKTAGQARSATTATQHGAIRAAGSGDRDLIPAGSGSIPVVAAPPNPTASVESDNNNDNHNDKDDDLRFPYHEFEEAMATVLSSPDKEAAKSGLAICKKIVVNATTKGQQPGLATSEKFRRVRLANPKIKAAIVDVPGNLELMMSIGFELVVAADDDESLLVFPPGCKGPGWLPGAIQSMEQHAR